MIDRRESAWRTSSYTGEQGNCVEVKLAHTVGVRDTKDREGGQLRLRGAAWRALLTTIRD
ncbi:DUF397 domain-containing protein [Amycolatopsis sp. NPDC059021]|uniref:DUF397 domain-containing protein n=1 Tax=Amycolatopsis sp. NPDC059021 TaxID=3346704 RepID=UPI00366FD5D2